MLLVRMPASSDRESSCRSLTQPKDSIKLPPGDQGFVVSTPSGTKVATLLAPDDIYFFGTLPKSASAVKQLADTHAAMPIECGEHVITHDFASAEFSTVFKARGVAHTRKTDLGGFACLPKLMPSYCALSLSHRLVTAGRLD